MSEEALTKALTLMDQYDEEKAAQVEKLESRIDHFEDRIGSYVIQITNRNIDVYKRQYMDCLVCYFS